MHVSDPDIKILYVEDDPQASELLEKLLRLKYPRARFLTADNGDRGLAAFSEHHPDVVVTDINLPGTNGIEMAREMKRLNPEVNIIAVSAYHDGVFFDEAAKLGFNGYITKPVEYRKLLAAINNCIEISMKKKGR